MTGTAAAPLARADALECLSDVLDVLEDALHHKPDGTLHHRKCLNRNMNASETPCSPRCINANDTLAQHRRAVPGPAREMGRVVG